VLKVNCSSAAIGWALDGIKITIALVAGVFRFTLLALNRTLAI
jgi:hypothetical protein